MTLKEFIKQNRKELDEAIRRVCPNIPRLNDEERRRCLTCGGPLVMAAVYEHGQEDESIYCPTCLEDPM